MNAKEGLAQNLDGVIKLDGERIVLTSSAVFGILRKDLIENLGEERMKGFLVRYGWNLGATDAKQALGKSFASIEEVLRQGTQLHMLKGYTNAETTSIDLLKSDEGVIESVNVSGKWSQSYEAEESLRLFGEAREPVCHTLTGYASGFYSTVCNKTIIFKEVSCRGAGDVECLYIGKTIASWAGEVEQEQAYYKNQVIIKELEKTYEQLLEERNNLEKAAAVHKKLSEELSNGNNLQSIARVMFNSSKIPIVIEDVNFKTIASAGLTSVELSRLNADLQVAFIGKEQIHQNKTIELETTIQRRLMTPIFLQKKIFGYCSFIYSVDEIDRNELDAILLERASIVCSLYLVNEKARFETEERVKGQFLDQIINNQFKSKEDIIKQGNYFHLNLSDPYYIIVIKQGTSLNEVYFNERVMEEVVHYFKNKKIHVLVGQNDGSTIMLIQAHLISETTGIKGTCIALLSHLKKIHLHYILKIGISSQSNDIETAYKCYEEAQIALKIGRQEEPIVCFEGVGITGILVHSQNKEAVEQKALQLLQPIYAIDDTKNIAYLQTLHTFLLNGGNLEKTMHDLSMSMSGLRYRIEKIEQLIGKNLRDPETAYELLFTLKALIAGGKLSF